MAALSWSRRVVLAHAELETATPADGVDRDRTRRRGLRHLQRGDDAGRQQPRREGRRRRDRRERRRRSRGRHADGGDAGHAARQRDDTGRIDRRPPAMATPSATTWTFTVAVAPTPSPTPVATAAPSAAPSVAPTPVPATPVPSAGADTGAIGRRQRHGEWQRRPPADHRRPDHPRRRGRLPAEPTQPPVRPDVIRDADLGRLVARPGSARRLGLAVGLAVFLPATVAAHTPQRDLHEPAAAGRLCRRGRHDGRPVVHVRHRPRRPGGPARPRRATGSLPPAWVRYPLRAIGLVGWIWIIAQGIAGNSSDGDVATLFLWVYGWVGVAILCALVGPVWHFLDPFSTLHDLGAAAPAPARGRGLGHRRLPGATRSLAGDHRLRVLRLARAGDLRRRRRRCSSSSSATRP